MLGGVNMREAQIYIKKQFQNIKNIRKQKICLNWGSLLSQGGGGKNVKGPGYLCPHFTPFSGVGLPERNPS